VARALPVLTKVGIVALGFAGLLDLFAHLEVNAHIGHLHQHTSAEASAHLAAFVSMVLIYLGVVLDGARQARRHRTSAERDMKGVA
jgi:uncharacterized membrane-anchored protein